MKITLNLLLLLISPCILNAQWNQIAGPSSRTSAISVKNDTVYAAGWSQANRGFFRSYNGGSNWERVDTTLLMINGINYVISIKSQGDNLYAGTNKGVFYSTNDGETWTEYNTGILPSTEVNEIEIIGMNVYLATSNGVYLSSIGVDSWTLINTGLPAGKSILCIEQFGVDLFVGVATGGVYKSTNNGNLWSAFNTGLTSSTVQTIAAYNSEIYIGTNSGGVFKSPTSVSSWNQLNSGLTSSNIKSLTKTVSNFLIAGTSLGVFVSSDGGNNWYAQNNGLRTYSGSIDIVAANYSKIFAVSPTGVFTSLDNGSTWNGSGANEEVLAIDNKARQVFTSTNNAVYYSDDGNNSCVDIIRGFNGYYSQAITKSSTNTSAVTRFFFGTNGGGIYKTHLNSFYAVWPTFNWTQINNGLSNLDVKSLAMSPPDIFLTEYLFAGTNGGGIFLSTDFGNNWTSTNFGLNNLVINALEISNSNSNIFAATNAGLYSSSNYGSTWVLAGNGFPADTVLCIASQGTAVVAGTKNSGVYYSNNSGTSWSNIGLNSNIIQSIEIKNSNIIVGTKSNGVLITQNNGVSWSPSNTNLLNLDIKVMKMRETSDTLLIGTNGEGAWFQRIPNIISINENVFSQSNQVNLFPNPATKSIKIEAENIKKIELFDCTGRLIIQFDCENSSSEKIDISNLSSGAYFIRIYSGENNQVLKKCIKNN